MKSARTLTKALLALALAGATFAATSASAEVVLHRGNGGEPQTLDQAHTSIDVEANILKDLYEGLTVYDARPATSSPASPRAGRSPTTA